MKKLQNNYTTPEQSKRLLELGIPINSSDIIYYHTPDSWYDPYLITEDKHIENLKSGKGLPCWSVGRLIEIMKICNHPDDVDEVFCELAYSKKNLVELIVRLMEENKEIIDFSKLEE